MSAVELLHMYFIITCYITISSPKVSCLVFMTSSFCEISGVVITSMTYTGMLMSNIQVLSNVLKHAKPNFYIYKIVVEF